MSKWSDIENPIDTQVEIANIHQEKADTQLKREQSFSTMTPIVIDTVDGRKVEAMVHQASRSVYPKLDK